MYGNKHGLQKKIATLFESVVIEIVTSLITLVIISFCSLKAELNESVTEKIVGIAWFISSLAGNWYFRKQQVRAEGEWIIQILISLCYICVLMVCGMWWAGEPIKKLMPATALSLCGSTTMLLCLSKNKRKKNMLPKRYR